MMQFYRLTTDPVNLIGANGTDGQPLRLDVGQTYTGRFVGMYEAALAFALTVPDGTVVTAADSALPFRNFEDVRIAPVSGESLYVWSTNGGELVIEDIPT